MERVTTKLIILLLATFLSSTSLAGIWCTGDLRGAYVNSGGEFIINGSWRKNWTKICSVNGTWNGVTTEVCKAWLTKVDAAVISGTTVTLMYGDHGYQCDNLPTYSNTPAPAYVMLNKPGL